MITGKLVYIGIDLQKAFGRDAQSPKLATLASGEEGNETREVANNARLAEAVYDSGGTVIVTKDWHNPVGTRLAAGVDNRSADEFEKYGVHAIPASGDADLNAPIEEVICRLETKDGRRRTVIPVDEHEASPSGDSERILEVHKNVYDVNSREVLQDGVVEGPVVPNEAFLEVLRRQAAEGPVTVVMGGKIAEVCVRAGVLGLLAQIPGLSMVVPEDAVSSLPSQLAHQLGLPDKTQVMDELRSHGVKVVKTQDVLDWIVT